MSESEPHLVTSSLSCKVTRDGISLEVGIYRLETETGWSLEVINAAGTSIVWDDLFPTEEAALAEFERTVVDEGTVAFLDGGKVIPFRR